ncbi:hypothetical protein LTR53_015643 [Teratosphaeriaceae sp. CCFEE 6253]|nr:hypothetical protein LTR53_015643 [Teratosphaeriaceae sp. CCFEE 6253]
MRATLASVLLASVTSAYVYEPTLGGGYGPNAAPVLFAEAARDPIDTNTQSFTFGSGTAEWQWRVNVTNVATPNATSENPSVVTVTPDPHVAYTTYDLSWSGDGTLTDELARLANTTQGDPGAVSMCAYVVYGKLVNTTVTDCASALGDQCLQSLMSDLAVASSTGGSCSWVPSSTSNGCGDLLSNTPHGLSTIGFQLGNSTLQSNASAPALRKGESFFYHSSEAAPATDLAYLAEAEQTLQILALEVGGLSQMLCMSFDDAAAAQNSSGAVSATNASSGAASASGTSAAPSSTSSSAGVAGAGSVVGFGVLGFAGLAACFATF